MTKRDVILQRTFDLKHRSGEKALTLLVLRPRRTRTGDYGCSYEIRVSRKVVVSRGPIYGSDAVQALLLALGLVDIDLERIERERPGRRIPDWQRDDLRRLKPAVPAGDRSGSRSRR